MATLITGASGTAVYRRLVSYVLAGGDKRNPRGLATLDLGYTSVELDSPYNALPLGQGRNLSRRIAAAEAVQLIGAFADPQLLLDASPNFKNYVEDDGTFWGAYGRRIGAQLRDACTKLSQDHNTRQALITLWDPALDNQPHKRDYPCTMLLGLSFSSTGLLELDVTMRSNDVWKGLPYDIFQFTQLQLTVARLLKVEPGRYRHHTYSLHLYESDVEVATKFTQRSDITHTEEQPTGFGAPGDNLFAIQQRARTIAYATTATSCTDSERWYWHVLRGDSPALTFVDPQ